MQIISFISLLQTLAKRSPENDPKFIELVQTNKEVKQEKQKSLSKIFSYLVTRTNFSL
jgi:hypothetical protein